MNSDVPAIDPVEIIRRAYELYASRGGADDRALDDCLDAWQLARTANTNLLLTGPENITSTLVDALFPFLREPVIALRPGEPLVLAPTAEIGTLILHDVWRLALADQFRLLNWQDRATRRTQVISTTSTPLLPVVNAGGFLGELYYRLNTVSLEVTI